MATADAFCAIISRHLKDEDHTNWSLEALRDYLNQCTRLVVRYIVFTNPDYWLRTGRAKLATENIAIGANAFDLPAQCLRVLKVAVLDADGNRLWLDPIDIGRVDAADVQGYNLYDDDIHIYPDATEAVVGGCQVYYAAWPDRLTLGTEQVPFSDDFFDLYLMFGISMAKLSREENSQGYFDLVGLAKREAGIIVAMTNMSYDAAPEVAVEIDI